MMVSIIGFVFTAFLVHQGIANYAIDVVSMRSTRVSHSHVTYGDEQDSNWIITFDEQTQNSTFEATFWQVGKFPGSSLEGIVCGNDGDQGPAAESISKILTEIIDSDDCPPLGAYTVKRSFVIEGDGFSEYLKPGFETAGISIGIFHPLSDGSKARAFSISLKISEGS
ncbi:uncharacterized protein [Fopius arisanus]|uniref:UxaC_2 protein n=1 Tax=Fopius arisanus TaxID=64838 RepID=A0A0C9RMB4_9HYME|nr:PREDICTED: uncharacterized protein LOC105273785 [Fopius arisanus]